MMATCIYNLLSTSTWDLFRSNRYAKFILSDNFDLEIDKLFKHYWDSSSSSFLRMSCMTGPLKIIFNYCRIASNIIIIENHNKDFLEIRYNQTIPDPMRYREPYIEIIRGRIPRVYNIVKRLSLKLYDNNTSS